MISILILFLVALITFIRPIFGFAVFMVMHSGMIGFIEQYPALMGSLGPFSIYDIGLIVGIFAQLLHGKTEEKISRKTSEIRNLIWIFTIVVFLSRVNNLGSMHYSEIVWVFAACLIWGPLFECFQKFPQHQRLIIKKFIIFTSTITAFLTVLIVVTQNDLLFGLLSLRRYSQSATPEVYSTARITLPGLWTVMPFGFWFCMHELFRKPQQSPFRIIGYGVSAGLMFTTVLFNLSRNLILGTFSGLLFAVVIIVFILDSQAKFRMVVMGIFLVCIFAMVLIQSEDIYNTWTERFDEGIESQSVQGRIDRNIFMIDLLFSEFPILGDEELIHYSNMNGPRSDQHSYLTIWLRFGFLGFLVMIIIHLVAVMRLFQIFKCNNHYSYQAILAAVFLTGSYLQFHWSMMSGDMMRGETVFAMIFLFSEIEIYASSDVSIKYG